MPMVIRLEAVAELDDGPTAVKGTRERARSGDGDSAWLLEQWEAGRVLLAQVIVTVLAEDGRGHELSVSRVVDGVWLERDDPPSVETQVADVAPAELPALGSELQARGLAVDDDTLDASFLHVELGDRLRASLTPAPGTDAAR